MANANASIPRVPTPGPAAEVRTAGRRGRRAPSSPRCRKASPAAAAQPAGGDAGVGSGRRPYAGSRAASGARRPGRPDALPRTGVRGSGRIPGDLSASLARWTAPGGGGLSDGEEPWASATPLPGSSVAMPSGPRAEPGPHHSGLGDRRERDMKRGSPTMNEPAVKTCIYPGCERPTRCRPTPAPVDPSPPSANWRKRSCSAPTWSARDCSAMPPAPHATPQEEVSQAATDEAYRAVFLRAHPTGKMVLSLTTVPTATRPAMPRSWPISSAFPCLMSRSSPPTPTASAPATDSTPAR